MGVRAVLGGFVALACNEFLTELVFLPALLLLLGFGIRVILATPLFAVFSASLASGLAASFLTVFSTSFACRGRLARMRGVLRCSGFR